MGVHRRKTVLVPDCTDRYNLNDPAFAARMVTDFSQVPREDRKRSARVLSVSKLTSAQKNFAYLPPARIDISKGA